MSGLVLTRSPNESFTIGDSVRVTVVDVRNGKARILIEAPREIPIIRDDAIRRSGPDRGSCREDVTG